MGSVSERLGDNFETEVRTLRVLMGHLERECPKGSFQNKDLRERKKQIKVPSLPKARMHVDSTKLSFIEIPEVRPKSPV